MSKEYGKLTADQFRELVALVPKLLEMIGEVERMIAQAPASKRDEVLSGDISGYSAMYELPLSLHVATTVVALNRQDDLAAFSAAPDPQQAALDGLMHDQDDDKPHNEAFEMGEVVALAYSVWRTFVSMATYGRSISSLLEEVRERGDRDALFNAVRMDRAVIGCPTVMNAIAKAQISGDKEFFRGLAKALKGPGKRQMAPLNRMRFAFLLLREMGVDDLTQAEVESLIVDKLGVYAPGTGDAKKNLWPHYTKSRKLRSI